MAGRRPAAWLSHVASDKTAPPTAQFAHCCDFVVKYQWGAVPRDDLLLMAFADDMAVALRNAFLDVVNIATGHRLNPRNNVVR